MDVYSKSEIDTKIDNIELTSESISSSLGYTPANQNNVTALQSLVGDTPVATQINNAISTKAPAYTYGTTDLEAGTSALETGKLYFVYE